MLRLLAHAILIVPVILCNASNSDRLVDVVGVVRTSMESDILYTMSGAVLFQNGESSYGL